MASVETHCAHRYIIIIIICVMHKFLVLLIIKQLKISPPKLFFIQYSVILIHYELICIQSHSSIVVPTNTNKYI